MEFLMKAKLAIKKFVGKNEVFITPILKFLLTFLALSRISSRVGFMSRLASKPVVLIVALAGSFLPFNLTLFIIALITVAHMYALSLECAVVVLAVFLILFLLYFRFASEDSVGGMLTPLSFVYHMPMVMPVSMGLVGTPSSMVAVGSGVIIYEMLHFIADNSDALTGGEDGDTLGQFQIIVDALMGNKEMIVYVAAFAVTVLVVYLIRRLAIKYAWLIAIGVGEIVLFLVTLIANSRLSAGISAGSAFLGVLVSAVINVILCYFCFDLNYNKIEKVQFEDDEYYYYVKAVPKNEYLEKPKKKKNTSERSAASDEGRSAVQGYSRVNRTEVQPRESVRTEETHTQTSQRTRTVSDEAAQAIRNRSSQTATTKGPLGLSGGRPAGEGRRLQELKEAQKNSAKKD